MFKVLEIGDPEWVGRVVGLGSSRRDLHFDQRMLAPFVAANKWQAYLALTATDEGYIVQPVLLTPEGDLRHAYNFGGPMASLDMLSSKEHVDSLAEWALRRNITSQYCTLVPSLVKEQLKLLSSSGIEPEFRKQSVVVDLNDQKIRGTTRRMANKAQGAGVTVKAYSLEHIKTFIDIYNFTMDRVKAKDHWRFSPKWFELFARFVNPCLLMATHQGAIEAACLIAYSHQYPVAYYHFAGSYNQFKSIGINHLLMLRACEFVKVAGIRYLYLGGGITDKEEDSLFIFKSGFSQLRLPVYSYKTLHNQPTVVN